MPAVHCYENKLHFHPSLRKCLAWNVNNQLWSDGSLMGARPKLDRSSTEATRELHVSLLRKRLHFHPSLRKCLTWNVNNLIVGGYRVRNRLCVKLSTWLMPEAY